jgi:hypothetical protein
VTLDEAVRGGTIIELQSGDFDREALFEIADPMMPATSPSP